jgi:hypothetical protein
MLPLPDDEPDRIGTSVPSPAMNAGETPEERALNPVGALPLARLVAGEGWRAWALARGAGTGSSSSSSR